MTKYPKRIGLWLMAFALPVLALDAAPATDHSRVFINFEPGSKAVAKGLVAQHRGTVHFEFDELGAIAATVPAAAIAGIQKNPNITFVEEDPPRYLYADSYPYGVQMVQANQLWDADNDYLIDGTATTGAGIKIGVIDSGIFRGHQDFGGVVMAGYPTGTNDATRWDYDGFGHGTHVSGTLAAALNGVGVTGVSPGQVSLFVVRVFGNDGAWIYSSTLIDAANRCHNAGAKVISMSLGGGRRSMTEDRGFKNLYGKGVLNVAAAGNDGTTTISYPAGYASVISVGAIDSNKTVASFSQFNSDVELAAPGVGVLSTVPYAETNTIAVGTSSYSGSHIEFSGRGSASGILVDGGLGDTTNTAWSGKVVLVQRGTVDFKTKVLNVQNSGGVACVIYNNVSGGFSGTLGTGNSSTIPALAISMEDGTALKTSSLGQTATVKSNVSNNVSGYDYYNGTSMATPHVAGVAAVIWSAAPTKTNAQVRTALQTTAQDLGAAGRDPYYGYGLIQAALAKSYLLSN